LCDLSGISTSSPFTGKSLKPLLKSGNDTFSRDYIVVELAADKENRSRKGRLIRTKDYHYAIYSNGEDQLYDLNRDPGEMHNLSAIPEYDSVRLMHREMLSQWMTATGDCFIPCQSSN
jgi:choline-sulfatase